METVFRCIFLKIQFLKSENNKCSKCFKEKCKSSLNSSSICFGTYNSKNQKTQSTYSKYKILSKSEYKNENLSLIKKSSKGKEFPKSNKKLLKSQQEALR